jgi:SDR family mycofactocin-dependent oxidoreductase
MGRLDGRVALVTGGGRGQGRAHALVLANEGATVVVGDAPDGGPDLPYALSSQTDLAETVRQVEAAGGCCTGVTLDVRDPARVQAVVDEAVDRFGRLDVLVANAGICEVVPLEAITDQRWDDMIATNLSGVFYCVRAVIPVMRRQRYGRVVVVSSLAGRRGSSNLVHYSATKFGVIGLAKSVAAEVMQEGITVNVLCPTTVSTPMVHNEANYRAFCPDLDHPTVDDVAPRFAALNPMRVPWLEPEVMARAMLHLVTDDGYVTGAVMEVGAGISAAMP